MNVIVNIHLFFLSIFLSAYCKKVMFDTVGEFQRKCKVKKETCADLGIANGLVGWRLIGKGFHGQVYTNVDENGVVFIPWNNVWEPIVVKCVHGENSREIRREFRIQMKLSRYNVSPRPVCPGYVHCPGSGSSPHRDYIFMEKMEGDLVDWLRRLRDANMYPSETDSCVTNAYMDIRKKVHKMHQYYKRHGDLHEHNIMFKFPVVTLELLSDRFFSTEWRLIDFGWTDDETGPSPEKQKNATKKEGVVMPTLADTWTHTRHFLGDIVKNTSARTGWIGRVLKMDEAVCVLMEDLFKQIFHREIELCSLELKKVHESRRSSRKQKRKTTKKENDRSNRERPPLP